MKMHIFGVLNSQIFSIANLWYTMEELSKDNKEKENDVTITGIVTSIQDASKFRFGFAAGTMWVMGVSLGANLDFDNGTIFYFMVSFLLVFFGGLLVIGGVLKFDINRRLAWVLPCVYCIYVLINFLF
jgi:F0F1-type ATP synthase assembly protein I